MNYKTDVLIIGAGVVGTAIARELSKFKLDVILCDKNDDVGGDASKSCSSCCSTESTVAPFTLESKLAQSSRPLFYHLCEDLEIPINFCGSITPVLNEEQLKSIPAMQEKAFNNGVYDVEFLTHDEIMEIEPTINPCNLGGLYSPRDSQISQFMLVIAQAENAAANGVEILLDCAVTGMEVKDGKIEAVNTTKGDIHAKWVINCAGLYCDEIAKMVDECDFTVHPRKGQFFVLSKDTATKPSHIIMSIPTPSTRGTLVIPTVDGNVLVGPTAEDITDKTDKKTTKEGLDFVTTNALALIPDLHMEDTITQFVGLRPAREPEGYHILVSEKVKGYVGISGIRSSGLTVSLGIAKYTIHEMQKAGLELKRKNGFIRKREGIVKFSDKSDEEKAKLIEKDPAYGKIICRCEQITESEILQAIRRPVGARTVDAVKRRVRAGMGRCQGGFCSPLVIEILAKELNMSPEEVRKRSGKSYMLSK